MRNAFEIPDQLLATGPKGGGVALMAGRATALLREGDATGLAVGRERIAWCLQGPGPTRLREYLDGSLRERRLADDDLDLHDLHRAPLALPEPVERVQARVPHRGAGPQRKRQRQRGNQRSLHPGPPSYRPWVSRNYAA